MDGIGPVSEHGGAVVVVRLTTGPYPDLGFAAVCACGWRARVEGSRFEAEGRLRDHVTAFRVAHLTGYTSGVLYEHEHFYES